MGTRRDQRWLGYVNWSAQVTIDKRAIHLRALLGSSHKNVVETVTWTRKKWTVLQARGDAERPERAGLRRIELQKN